jgi:hypothetical protein
MRYLSPAQPRYPELKTRLACPAPPPSYVIPGSHRLDPPYSLQNNPCAPPWMSGKFPFPRMPWPFESETRAFGTGLTMTDWCINPPTPVPPTPVPPPPCPPFRPWWWC